MAPVVTHDSFDHRSCGGPKPAIAAPLPDVGVNPGVVQTARASGISVRISEDLANIINDDAPLRVLPVVCKRAFCRTSPTSNCSAALTGPFCRWTCLDYARQQNLFPGWVSY